MILHIEREQAIVSKIRELYELEGRPPVYSEKYYERMIYLCDRGVGIFISVFFQLLDLKKKVDLSIDLIQKDDQKRV